MKLLTANSVNKSLARYHKSLAARTLCALIVGALFWFSPILANAQSNADRIRLNRSINKCWHKQSPDMNNGNIIHLWDCEDGTVSNRAYFYDRPTGYIRSSVMPSKCIHKQNDGWKKGDVIHLWDCEAGPAENKTFDYDARDGRVYFRFNPTFCADTKFIGFDNGNPISVRLCDHANSYTIADPKSNSSSNQSSVPCSNVRLGSETLVLEVKTGNLQGGGSSATIMIRLVFEDWDTGLFTLNSDRSFFAGGTEVIDTGIQIPGGCNRKGTDIKSILIENKGSSGVFSSDAWHLESLCARSSLTNVCGSPHIINKWINGGGTLNMGR